MITISQKLKTAPKQPGCYLFKNQAGKVIYIGNLKNLNRNIEFFTASFGQGITVTPLQLISAYNALANGGVLLKPQIVERVIYPDGSDEEILPEEVRRVVSQKAALQISQMLRSVVVKGHGKRADVPGYLVAGKTGTAQIPIEGHYDPEKTIASFVGFSPPMILSTPCSLP